MSLVNGVCRLAEIVGNKLRLEEEEDYRRQGQQLEEEVSESAKAMRDISAFQLMTQADGHQAQVQPLPSKNTNLSHYRMSNPKLHD